MATARWLGLAFTAALGCGAVGCGGGAALLHPAHVLGTGRVSAGAGASGQFVFGKGRTAIDDGRLAANGVGAPGDAERAFLSAAIAEAALAPGIAPWIGARVGLGSSNEGGLVYTGRAARVDARHAFGDDTVAVSVGAGASAVLLHPNRDEKPGGSPGAGGSAPALTAGRFSGSPGALSATGWGLDVPVIVGWRSSASLVEAWAGVRGGVERVRGDLSTYSPDGDVRSRPAPVTALRAWGGGLVGAAIGLRPFSVALELDVAYQSVSGSVAFPDASGDPSSASATVRGLTVAPTGAIIGKF